MSSKIVIHPDTVNQSIAGLDQSLAKLINTQNRIASLRGSIDPKIQSRRGIGSRITAANQSLDRVENKVSRVKVVAATSVAKYSSAETQMNKQADSLEADLIKRVLDNRMPSDLYELYNNTVGRLEDLLHGLQYSAGAGIMHLLGFRFTDVDGVLRRFELADNIKIGKYNVPFGSLISKVENSKLNFLARMAVNPLAFIKKYKNASLSELIYKRFSSFLPKDLVGLSNSVNTMRKAFVNTDTLKSGLSVVKNHAGDVFKSALKVGKSNWVLAAAITAGSETVGAGIKITENYSIYGGNIEKLKEENAKVIGEAAWKTGVVTATSVGGAMIGGAALSFLGPVGTVVGATAGGFVGSWVGDLITKNTPAIVENAAVKFKDAIYTGTEAIASGVNKVKEGFNDVKNFAGDLMNKSKNFFGSLSFGN